jgi:hypothetical protein
MAIEATIAGQGCTLIVRVSGYENLGVESGADANWLSAEAELAASTTGAFTGRHAVSLRTEEVLGFHDQLSRLLQTLSGEATLAHLEEQVGCTIRLRSGKGELDAFVREHVGAELRVTEIPTDQSYLQESLKQMDAIVATFPVRGSLFD